MPLGERFVHRKLLLSLALVASLGSARTLAQDHEHHAHAQSMPGALGVYPMSRDGSGTSWQPEAVPMAGLHEMQGPWM
jgi:hypothetical protein